MAMAKYGNSIMSLEAPWESMRSQRFGGNCIVIMDTITERDRLDRPGPDRPGPYRPSLQQRATPQLKESSALEMKHQSRARISD